MANSYPQVINNLSTGSEPTQAINVRKADTIALSQRKRRRSGKVDQRARVVKQQAQHAIDHLVSQIDNEQIPAFERNRCATEVIKQYYAYLASKDKKPREGTAKLPAMLTVRSQYAVNDGGGRGDDTRIAGGGGQQSVTTLPKSAS